MLALAQRRRALADDAATRAAWRETLPGPNEQPGLLGAAAVALREPLVTGRLLARRLGVSGRAGLDLATRLVEAGVLREMTGRAAWRAFAVA